MTDQIRMAYEAGSKLATLTFANGRQLKLRGVTEEQAKKFIAEHGEEFARRDCILHSPGGVLTRSDSNG